MRSLLDGFNGVDYGAVADGLTDNTVAFALADMDAGDVFRLPPGVFKGNIIVTHPGVKVVGSGKPYFDAATGVLRGGTVLMGTIALNGQCGAEIHALGVDTTSLPTVTALISSGGNSNPYQGSTPLYQTVEDVALLGKPSDGHGILFEVGSYVAARKIDCRGMIHGVAVKVPHAVIQSVRAWDVIYSGVIVKSDINEGDVFAVTLDMIDVVNAVAGNAAAVNVQGASPVYKTYDVTVGRVYAKGVQNGFLTSNVGNVGTVDGVNVSDYIAENCGQAGFYTRVGSNINVNGFIARSNPFNFRNDTATKVRVLNGTSITPGVSDSNGGFDVLHLGSQ